jgi:hypothetical protein
MQPFPAEHELLQLFECEPALTDERVPWAYNCLRFDTTRGVDRLVCELEPGYEELRLYWTRNGEEIIRLDLHRVVGLEVQLSSAAEALIASFRDQHVLPLCLQLKPTIVIRWGTSLYPQSS